MTATNCYLTESAVSAQAPKLNHHHRSVSCEASTTTSRATSRQDGCASLPARGTCHISCLQTCRAEWWRMWLPPPGVGYHFRASLVFHLLNTTSLIECVIGPWTPGFRG